MVLTACQRLQFLVTSSVTMTWVRTRLLLLPRSCKEVLLEPLFTTVTSTLSNAPRVLEFFSQPRGVVGTSQWTSNWRCSWGNIWIATVFGSSLCSWVFLHPFLMQPDKRFYFIISLLWVWRLTLLSFAGFFCIWSFTGVQIIAWILNLSYQSLCCREGMIVPNFIEIIRQLL